MNHGIYSIGIVIAIVFAILVAGCLSNAPAPDAGLPEPVTVAYSPFESTGLFWIAEERGFFTNHGVNITLKKYDSGAAALDGVVKGEADLCVGISEFPLVRKAFQNTSVRAIGNLDKGNFVYLVVRKDKIQNISDMKGKKIGTAQGTVAEFYLGRFLMLHGMGMQDITLVDVRDPAGWVNEVAAGDIDGISTAQPYANAAQARLGANGMAWPVQSSQPVFSLVITTSDWLSEHPATGTGFLAALAEAEKYTSTHPAEAREIIQRRLELNPAYMDTVWQQNQFALTLDQSLIAAMEDEARWMIANNMTNSTIVPDFRKYISSRSLEEVKPGSIRIIG
jgi:ABC-type nitrate/sulfonate/bicarbonate transport system substrate-binding protein